ncbi:MAG: lipoate--protein ligase [Candidatus Oleimicrobiaceae bacterium]
MQLFYLDKLPGQNSMLIFHALARMGVESLVIVSPQDPLVSIGYFQDAKQEIDLEYLEKVKIPAMRREVGGGATYLDGNQIFYQLIWRRSNPHFPKKISEIYEWFSQAPVETYREFGINARFRPVNDIVTAEGRKIAGEGGANIADCMVFVGGILLDFDYETMVRVLKVPEEKFRDKIFKSMEENLTTMKRELGAPPPREEIKRALVRHFERLVGPLEPAEMTSELWATMARLEKEFASPEFLFKKTPRVATGVKIREGVEISFGIHKAPGGLIRTVQEVERERIKALGISGDFTFYPKEELAGLENSLKGVKRQPEDIVQRVGEFCDEREVETPGVTPEDFSTAIMNAR